MQTATIRKEPPRSPVFAPWWSLIALCAVSLLRLWMISRLELQGDEAYYWVWSRHLDHGYYSKGPGIAWIIRAGTSVAGPTEFGVRWPTVVFALGTGLFIYGLSVRLFDPPTAGLALLIGLTVPLSWAGGLLMTIDSPTVFFCAAAAYFFARALTSNRTGWWAAAGLAVGGGTLCKFTALATLVSFALALWVFPEHRRHWRSLRWWMLVLLGLGGLLPPLIWNWRHGWVTARHLLERGALDRPFRLHVFTFLEFVGGQLLALSPFYVLALLGLSRSGAHRELPRFGGRYLVLLILPLLIFYALVSLNGRTEVNWTAPALTFVPVLLAALVRYGEAAHSALRRRAITALVLLHAMIGIASHAALLVPATYGEHRFRRIGGARSLAFQVDALMQRHDASYVIAGDYQTASLLAFYLPGQPRTFMPPAHRPTNQYFFWPSYRELHRADATAIYVGRHPLPDSLRAHFQGIRELEAIWSEQHGRRLRRYHAALLFNRREPRPPP